MKNVWLKLNVCFFLYHCILHMYHEYSDIIKIEIFEKLKFFVRLLFTFITLNLT